MFDKPKLKIRKKTKTRQTEETPKKEKGLTNKNFDI